jgi:hypothetical protein
MRSVEIELLERRIAGRTGEAEGDGRRVGRMQEQATEPEKLLKARAGSSCFGSKEARSTRPPNCTVTCGLAFSSSYTNAAKRLLIHRRRKHLLARHVEVAIEHPGADRSLQPTRRLVRGKHLELGAVVLE